MSANSTLSGREQARARRQAMKSGKAGVSQVARPVAQKVAVVEKTAPIAAAKSPVRRQVAPVAAPVAVSAGREAAKQARQKQISGKVRQSSQSTPSPRQRAKSRPEPEQVVEPRAQVSTAEAPKRRTEVKSNRNKVAVKSEPIAQSGGRNVAKAWRQAAATGKAGQSAYKSKGAQSGALAKMANPGASTREIARKIRAEKCSRGKAGCVPTKSAGANRVRQPKDQESSAVGESKTLSGQRVSGTTIGQGKKVMTGAETGACKLVSGTEYLGAEEFSMHCDSTPQASPAKVTMTQTTRGQSISGNEVGYSKKVSGESAGQCSSVTGTEYIPADQSALFCGADSKAKSAVQAFSVMSSVSQER